MRLGAALGLAAAALAACSGATLSSTVSGTVVDPNGNGVARVTVAVAGSKLTAQTDAAGHFALPGLTGSGGNTVLVATQAAYARLVRPLAAQAPGTPVILTLRPADLVATVALPAAGQAPVTTTVQRPDGPAMAVTLAPGSLVDGAGHPAAGQAQVKLTYWHPADDLASITGPLTGLDASGAPTPLSTFGMGDIEVLQNGAPLQVAAGGGVTWKMSAAPAQAAAVAAGTTVPRLLSLDPDAGAWRDMGGLDDGRLVFDPNAQTFTAALPHLSGWNVDAYLPHSYGGCVQGTLVSACDPNHRIANHRATVMFTSATVNGLFRTASDAAGNFCLSTPTEPWPWSYGANGIPYIAWGATWQEGGQCRPYSDAAMACWDNSGYSNGCTAYYSHNGCAPQPTVAIRPCHFCPGDPTATCTAPQTPSTVLQGCAQLQPIRLAVDGCVCDAAGNCPQCSAAEGEPCSAQRTCCYRGDGTALGCYDGLCVPVGDIPDAVE